MALYFDVKKYFVYRLPITSPSQEGDSRYGEEEKERDSDANRDERILF
jgi:hypothetical protein